MIQFNLFLFFFLAAFLLRSMLKVFLNLLNISYLRQHTTTVPQEFQDMIDLERLKKISAYTIDSDHFLMVSALANQGLFLAILLSGFLPWMVKIIQSWKYGMIAHGLIFFAVLSVLANLLRIPFSLYDTFVIENRYGFNVMSLKVWVADLVKSVILSCHLGRFSPLASFNLNAPWGKGLVDLGMDARRWV